MSEGFKNRRNDALGDELLTARFIAGLSDGEMSPAAVYFGALAAHIYDTAIIYESPDTIELFKKILDLRTKNSPLALS